jgi:hypothetical protein
MHIKEKHIQSWRIGDLIEAIDPAMLLDASEDRRIGNILRFDTYKSPSGIVSPEQIVEIHWNNGEIGWILHSRIRLVKDAEELTDAQLDIVQGRMTSSTFMTWRHKHLPEPYGLAHLENFRPTALLEDKKQ